MRVTLQNLSKHFGPVVAVDAIDLEVNDGEFVALLGRLNIATDTATAAHALGDTLHLARRYKLSAYDAAYLELALRTGSPLATLDADPKKAARAAGVQPFAPN